jgi:DegV family protein with EDD domain
MVKIVTDSNSGITPDMAKQLGIMGNGASYVNFGDKSYKDTIELSSEQFYEMLRSAPELPKTAAPSVGDFEEIYSKLKGEEVVSVHLSRALSGTIQSAETAAGLMDGDPRIHVVDTRFVNAGQTLLVLEALELAKAGHSAAEIKAQVEALVPRVRMSFVLDTLENLKRGGRISSTSALIGGLLQMKPILTLKEGKVEPLERVRTSSKALARLKEIALQDLAGKTNPKVVFFHANTLAAVNAFKRDVSAQLGLQYDAMVLEAGPAVATHAGPGAIGLAYIV